MECRKCKGATVTMKLAGRLEQPGIMIDIGEVMVKEGLRRHDDDIAWLLLLRRMMRS